MQGVSPDDFRDYSDALYAFAKTRVASDDDILDLVQDTLADFLRKPEGFRGEASVLTYLTAILKNKIYDLYRQQKRSIAMENSDLDMLREESGIARSSDESHERLAARDTHESVLRAVHRLQSPYFEAFVMREIDELSTTEICKKLGVTVTNLNVILYRARNKLMQILQEEGITRVS